MYYDDNRQWICINGYNGYEYSNDGLLRSMKNFKVNPTGKLIKKYRDKNGVLLHNRIPDPIKCELNRLKYEVQELKEKMGE